MYQYPNYICSQDNNYMGNIYMSLIEKKMILFVIKYLWGTLAFGNLSFTTLEIRQYSQFTLC